MRVFHHNKSCLLALILLHNSREYGASKAALILMKNSHFNRTLQYLQEMLSHVVVLISGAVEREVVVVKEVKTLWTAGLLQVGVVQLNVKVEQRLVLNFRLA